MIETASVQKGHCCTWHDMTLHVLSTDFIHGAHTERINLGLPFVHKNLRKTFHYKIHINASYIYKYIFYIC